MIASLIAGGAFRFLLRFIPSICFKAIDVFSEHMMQKRNIEFEVMKLEMWKHQSYEQIESDENRLEIPLRMSRIRNQKVKSRLPWVLAINDLVRPLTTFFWTVFYPSLIMGLIYKGAIEFDPLSVLCPFAQETISFILGFWYADKVVEKKRS